MPIAAEVSATGVESYESASESDYYYESTSDSDYDCGSSDSEYRKFIARKNSEAAALTVRKGTENSVGNRGTWESTSEDSDSDSSDSGCDSDEEEDYQKFLTRKKAEATVSSRRPRTTATSPKTTKDAVSSDTDSSTYDSASYSNSDIDPNSGNGSDRVVLSSAATVVVGPKSVQPRFTNDGWLIAIVEDQKKQLSMRLKEKEYIETYLLEKQRQHMREQDDAKVKKSKKTEMHPNPKKKKNKQKNKEKQNHAPEKQKKKTEEGGKQTGNSETQNKRKESIERAIVDDTSVACKANTPQTSIETGPLLADSSNQATNTKDLVDGGKLGGAKKSGVRQKLFFWKKSNKKSPDWGGTQNRPTI